MPKQRWDCPSSADRYSTASSTPESPAHTTASSTRSSRNMPKPSARQNTSFDARYSMQQTIIVRR